MKMKTFTQEMFAELIIMTQDIHVFETWVPWHHEMDLLRAQAPLRLHQVTSLRVSFRKLTPLLAIVRVSCYTEMTCLFDLETLYAKKLCEICKTNRF